MEQEHGVLLPTCPRGIFLVQLFWTNFDHHRLFGLFFFLALLPLFSFFRFETGSICTVHRKFAVMVVAP
jgi:hypothetical protein